MTSAADPHGAAAARLGDAEQRYTAGRHQIVSILVAAARPLTIPEILRAGTGLAQSSAYRNLSVLEEAGVVRRVHATGDVTRYELAEDLTEHHHHLVCARCGSIEDFTVPSALERAMDGAVPGIEAASGFEVHGHRLDFVGLCRGCRARG